jgi:hypothetical protein
MPIAARYILQAVLRTARLPTLVSLTETGDPSAPGLWDLTLEAALDFETKLGPFLGAAGLQVCPTLLPPLLYRHDKSVWHTAIMVAISQEVTHRSCSDTVGPLSFLPYQPHAGGGCPARCAASGQCVGRHQ